MTWIIAFIEQFGYLAILLLIALENLFPPIPSEIILTFSGFMITHSNITLITSLIAATLGSLIGSLFLYAIGYYFNEEKLTNFIINKGKWLSIKKEHIDKTFNYFKRYGYITIFFTRFIPIVRSLISIPAGMAHMPIIPFMIYTVLGSLIWNFCLIVLGYYAGENYKIVSNTFSHATHLIFIIIFIVIIAIFIFKYLKKRH